MDHMQEGLSQDLQTLLSRALSRRESVRMLQGLVGMSALSAAGCGGGGGSSATSAAPVGVPPAPSTPSTPPTPPSPPPAAGSAASPAAAAPGACSTIPSETGGPYPGDGTNTASGATSNVLTLAGVARSDIRSSISGYGSGTAAGVNLTVNLSLKSVASGCTTALSGYAVYLWHCDALGRYSLYSGGATAESYLRGLQVADSSGKLSFTSIYPGCYSGRWPHIHFEIFATQAAATRGSAASKTSQLALPEAESRLVYASSGYSGSVANLNGTSLSSDNVFSDGVSLQLASMSGSVAAGYVANLNVYL